MFLVSFFYVVSYSKPAKNVLNKLKHTHTKLFDGGILHSEEIWEPMSCLGTNLAWKTSSNFKKIQFSS